MRNLKIHFGMTRIEPFDRVVNKTPNAAVGVPPNNSVVLTTGGKDSKINFSRMLPIPFGFSGHRPIRRMTASPHTSRGMESGGA
jgi:hypothetical protein